MRAKFKPENDSFVCDDRGVLSSGFEEGEFDQVIVAIGNERKLPDFLRSIPEDIWKPIIRPGGTGKGSGSESLNCGFSEVNEPLTARLRVLGPAARALWDKRTDMEARSGFLANMPKQIDGGLVTVEALQISWANGLFGPAEPNRNVNTADAVDLSRLGVGKAASWFLADRGGKIEPYGAPPPTQQGWGLVSGY